MPKDDSDKRLDDLRRRLDRARGEAAPEDKPSSSASSTSGGLAAALRLSSELVAGVVAGGGLGYFLDKGLGTSPFGLIAFILIGFAAGTLNLVRAASRRNDGEGKPPETGSGG